MTAYSVHKANTLRPLFYKGFVIPSSPLEAGVRGINEYQQAWRSVY